MVAANRENVWQQDRKGDGAIILHAGGRRATWDEVQGVSTPQRTDTWVPVPHARVVELVARTMQDAGLSIIDASYGLVDRPDCPGARFFGLLEVAGNESNGHSLIVGLRNSHDQSFPVKLACGSRVFVCDNLSFSGEVVVTRRHTARVESAMPGLIARAIGEIGNLKIKQEQRFEAYHETPLDNLHAHDLIVRALNLEVIAGSTVQKVLHEWRHPQHEEFEPRTVWSLFNAFTETLKAIKPEYLPQRTIKLHGIADAACGLSFLAQGENVIDEDSTINVRN